MRPHPPTRRIRVAAAIVVVIAACTGDAGPTDPRPEPTASGAAPTVPTTPADGGGPAGPVEVPDGAATIEPPGGATLRVRGTYPRVESRCLGAERPTLDARYPGSLEVERDDAGRLRLVLTTTFERYLEGIAEVPPSWPRAALEAQAIAARSYALARIGFDGPDGAAVRTPICATAACQVYRGIPVEPTPGVGRWYGAVRRTSGRALVSEGRAADAVYFSTSNGRTYGNEEVFGSAPLPYLRPTVERHDGASPTSRWRVSLAYRDLARFLAASDLWPEGRPIRRVARRGDAIVVTGGGATRRIAEDTFRASVNAWSACLSPGRYPPPARGGGRLPVTVPSRWFTARARSDAVVLTGRGWGHGAGMVQ
ncbi:MAG TPA: SpoIID/LytB domain-containing protein, partial [Actinomycetota bacterium]